jgi:hypothetical protein
MDKSEMLLRMMGLVRCCPAGNRMPDWPCCQLSRRQDLKYCYFYFSGMSKEDLGMLYQQHLNCFNKRDSSAFLPYSRMNSSTR